MNDIPLFKVFMSEDVLKPVSDILMSGYVGQGSQVDKFEKKLSTYFNNKNVLTFNSGTSALHLALHITKMEISSEIDEVLTTPLTCAATNFPILANGLKVKWVDLDPETCNVDLSDLESKISSKTAAIMVVHWAGYPVDLDRLKSIQYKAKLIYGREIPIIEDCAHAIGAEYKGVKIGNSGNYCMFSFQAIKHLTTCDGGLLVTKEDKYQLAKLLRWYGLDRESSADFRCEQNIENWGYKFHMNDLAATIGLYNFPHLEKIVSKHQENANWIHDKFLNNMIDGIKLLERKNDRKSADWVYTIRVSRRNDFIKMMKSKNIGVSQVHSRNDIHNCLKEFRSHLPKTNEVCSDMCCIPCGWWVTPEDRQYIFESIKSGW